MDSKATFLGCGKVSDTKTDIYRNKTIEEVCGLVRLKQIISSRTIDIGMLRSQATSDDSPLYSQEFRKALKELNENNAYAFLNKFRTHLVVSADLGEASNCIQRSPAKPPSKRSIRSLPSRRKCSEKQRTKQPIIRYIPGRDRH